MIKTRVLLACVLEMSTVRAVVQSVNVHDEDGSLLGLAILDATDQWVTGAILGGRGGG